MPGVMLLVAVAATLLADQAAQKTTLSVKAVSGLNAVVDLEMRNTSEKLVESKATFLLTLRPLDRGIHPLFDGILSAQVCPITGRNEDRESRNAVGPLRLPPGGVRVTRVELTELRWSLGPNWVWQPRSFWELASSGEYELLTQLVFDNLSLGHVRLPARLRIHVAGR